MIANDRTGPGGIPIPDVSDKNAGLIKHLVNRRGLHQGPEEAKNG